MAEAVIPCQLRPGMCKLNKYLHRIVATESDITMQLWSQSETVDHYSWLEQRRNLQDREQNARRLEDQSFALRT